MSVKHEDIIQEAIKIVEGEVRAWTDSNAWVTTKVAFRMRDLIEQLRKNYWGVFDKPIDPITGRKKIWIPLTQSLCDAVTKNLKLKESDVKTRAKQVEGIPFSTLVRALVRNFINVIYFGEHLDEGARTLAIDGTLVWKTVKIKSKPEKTTVDLLNCYIDPTSESIQKAFRFTERALLTENDVKGMSGWRDTENIKAALGLQRRSKEYFDVGNIGSITPTAQYVDVYETWGQIPKWLITGTDEDRESGDMIEGHLVVSGLHKNKGRRVHLVERNMKGLKPYEEAWYIKEAGRWYGVGIAEKVLMLQLWMNTIVNIRINRSYVSQLGLFIIRRGSGITPQMITRLGANGAIQVNSIDDIEQLTMQEASQASYQDEGRIIDWAQRVTSAFETITGEALAPSTTATAIATQSQTAQSQFSMVKKGFSNFLERWFDRHVIPVLAKGIKSDDLIRALGDDLIEDIADRVALHTASEELDKMFARGEFPSKKRLKDFIQATKDDILSQPELFIKNVKSIISDMVETEIVVGDEEVNQAVIARELTNLLNIVQLTRPELVEPIAKQVFDLLGLEYPKVKQEQQRVPTDQQQVTNSPDITQMLQGAITQGNG